MPIRDLFITHCRRSWRASVCSERQRQRQRQRRLSSEKAISPLSSALSDRLDLLLPVVVRRVSLT
jgi:hypothetical protein